MNENVSAWLSAVEGLPEAHARLGRVEIRNMDACEFIQKYDHPKALFYCDPPYLHQTRHEKAANNEYTHEMTFEQHDNLLSRLSAIIRAFQGRIEGLGGRDAAIVRRIASPGEVGSRVADAPVVLHKSKSVSCTEPKEPTAG